MGQLQTWRLLNRLLDALLSHRHWLLLSCLMGAAGNSLLFYFVHQPGYDHAANLIAAAVFLGIALFVPYRRAYVLLSNLALLTAVSLMAYVTACTGGINSPAMVWMTILAVPALLLLGRRWAQGWVALIVLVIVAQFVLVMQGQISGEVDQSPGTIVWALLDKVLVIVSLMLVVNFYEGMHRRQMRALEQGNADLEATHRALLQAQSHKDEFIASVGHELRTPMNAILGLNGVLLDELADQPENVQMAAHIRDSTRQLLRLVNDILDFSQLEAGRLSVLQRPLHVASSVLRIVSVFEQRAREKSLDLRLHIDPSMPPRVMLDGQRLEQVLANLLDNALKFTAQGHIALRVRPEHGFIRFEIEDTGRGIAADRQQQVFNRFEHADIQTNRAYGGTGLGLAICEQLVRLQGGRIGVHSSPEKGSLFWFELPLQPAEPEESRTLQPLPASAAPLRFLLVDDNTVNLMVAQLMIKKCWPGASVSMAGSGQKALALLDEQAFDVVMMDMVMPGLDGLETTRRLRQHARREIAQLPVIGLTAQTHAHDRRRCLDAGMNDVLSKPMDAQAVMEVVERLRRHATLSPGA